MSGISNVERKKELRKQISALKKAVSIPEREARSGKVVENLKRMQEFSCARNILLYWSLPDEVYTHELVQECFAEGKNVFLPVVDGEDLKIRRFTGVSALEAGESFGIPEPETGAEEVAIDDIDLVVVPGVAFDMGGGRMGRGKGFYDRMFAKIGKDGRAPYKIGICFDFQIVEDVPKENHDMLMDAVIGETRSGKAVHSAGSSVPGQSNRICSLFGIRYPIVSGGMVWCSGWRLAAAVSNAGGLGLIGAGSMKPDLLREHISKCREATKLPFGVNIPLMSPYSADLMQVVVEEKIPVVFTSAGNPKLWTAALHDAGIKVVHVVSSSKFALKSQEAGVDAVVAEGFEAGGHNGKEETATMVLIPAVRSVLDIPLIAAGGIATGAGMAAAFALGAEGVQVGTRFAMTEESSADPSFKMLCTSLQEGDTMLALKKISPTRLVKNKFFAAVSEAEDRGASADELRDILGRGKARAGIFEGELDDGELEIGQAVSLISDIPSAMDVVTDMIADYNAAVAGLKTF